MSELTNRRRGVAINEDAMEEGLRFPLHPRISKILNKWHLAPTQIMPNGWSMVIGILNVSGTEQIPSVDEVLSLTNLAMAYEEENGWYNVQAQANHKIVEDLSNKVDGWKAQFGGSQGIGGVRWMSLIPPIKSRSRQSLAFVKVSSKNFQLPSILLI